MLTDLTEEGHASWYCRGCDETHTAHISHPQMEWVPQEHVEAIKSRFQAMGIVDQTEAERLAQQVMAHHDTISLPPCKSGRLFLKASFTDEELAAPNMSHPEAGQPTESHAAAHRHMQLAKQMALIGKGKPGN